jgi:hypothetical protein
VSTAFRNFLKDTTRFALSVIGMALAVMLILLLNGFLSGTARIRQASHGRLSVGLLTGSDMTSAVLLISNQQNHAWAGCAGVLYLKQNVSGAELR